MLESATTSHLDCRGRFYRRHARLRNHARTNRRPRLQGKALYNLAHATYQQGRKTYETGDPQTALDQVKKAEALFQSAQEIDTSDTSIHTDIEQSLTSS